MLLGPCFSGPPVQDAVGDRVAEMKAEIEQATDDYILSVGEATYIEYLVGKHGLEVPEFNFGDCWQDEAEEREVRGEEMPDRIQYTVEPGQTFRRPVYRFCVPLSGYVGWLHHRPRRFSPMNQRINANENALFFEIIGPAEGGAEEVGQVAEKTLKTLEVNVNAWIANVQEVNAAMRELAETTLRERKQRTISRRSTMAAIGIPIRLRDNLPATYAIPPLEARRKVSIQPPPLTESDFMPDPTMDDQDYQVILKMLDGFLREIERHPSLYERKVDDGSPDRLEEALRDQLLLHLAPQFEGSATAETFNAAGKTDILVRHDNKNAFVAECKIWGGPSDFLASIDQLLGYLTWRDSKAALVVFVRNQEISAVVSAIAETIGRHSCYVRTADPMNEAWTNHILHLPSDANREVRLAVLLCHIGPPS